MNTSNIITKFLITLCLLAATGLSLSAQVTAIWTGGAADFQWNNPANWSWSSGSGVPTATTNVVVHNIAAPINIGPVITASCKDLTIDGGNANEISIGTNSRLVVHGNIIQNGPHTYLDDCAIQASSAAGAELIFAGSGPQVLRSVMVYVPKVRINKMAGNVIVDSSCRLFIRDTLFLESKPAAIGTAVKGNLEIRRGVLIRDVHGAVTKLPAYSETEIPPHVVCTQYPVTVDDEVSYIVGDVISSTGDEGINGTILFPVGENDSSYTPVTVTQTGTNTNAWNVHITKPKSASCSSNPISGAQAVKHGFNVLPLERNLSSVLSTITTPATITMSYHTANSGDVPAGYNTANNSKSAYAYNQTQGCWDKLPASIQTGAGFKTVTLSNQVNFSQYAVGASGGVGVPDVPNDTKLSIYPNPVVSAAMVKIITPSKKNLTVSVIDFTGRKLAETRHIIEKGTQIVSLNTSGFPSGTYLLQLTDEDGAVLSKTFVKQ